MCVSFAGSVRLVTEGLLLGTAVEVSDFDMLGTREGLESGWRVVAMYLGWKAGIGSVLPRWC